MYVNIDDCLTIVGMNAVGILLQTVCNQTYKNFQVESMKSFHGFIIWVSKLGSIEAEAKSRARNTQMSRI